jgi:hypothetical protein
MSIITMNMSSYAVEDSSFAEDRREMELANRAQQAELALQQVVEQTGRRSALPPSLANIDAGTFLQEMYDYRA